MIRLSKMFGIFIVSNSRSVGLLHTYIKREHNMCVALKKNIKDNNKCRPMACICIYRYSRIIDIIVSFHTFWKTLKTTGVCEYYTPT